MGEIIYLADRAKSTSKPLAPSTQPTDPAQADHVPVEPLWHHLVGGQFRQIRQDRGETLSQVAKKAGVSPQYLSEVERGRKEPSSEMIAAISHALNLTLLDLTLAATETLRNHSSQPLRGEYLMAA